MSTLTVADSIIYINQSLILRLPTSQLSCSFYLIHHPNSFPRHTSSSHTPTLLLPSCPSHLVHILALPPVVPSPSMIFPNNSLMSFQRVVIWSVPNDERWILIPLPIDTRTYKIYPILKVLFQREIGENQWQVHVRLILAAGWRL